MINLLTFNNFFFVVYKTFVLEPLVEGRRLSCFPAKMMLVGSRTTYIIGEISRFRSRPHIRM